MKLTYPAIFAPCEEHPGFYVRVPDLPGCVTQGNDLADAILMGQDAASGWVLVSLEEGRLPPQASSPEDIQLESGEFISYLLLDMDDYAEKYGDKSVRKNLTIPAWLNTFSEKANVNFSQVLTEALTKIFEQQYA